MPLVLTSLWVQHTMRVSACSCTTHVSIQELHCHETSCPGTVCQNSKSHCNGCPRRLFLGRQVGPACLIHIHTKPSPACSYLAEQFCIGLGLQQLRSILGQCVVQLVSLIVSSVIHLLDLKYVCKVCNRRTALGRLSCLPHRSGSRAERGSLGKAFCKKACNLGKHFEVNRSKVSNEN